MDRSFYRFVTIHACDRRTDRRTDRILITISRLHYMQRGKNDGQSNNTEVQRFQLWQPIFRNTAFRCLWATYTTEEAAMLFDLSNDVSIIEQLGKHQRSLVTNLESLCLKHNLLLTFCSVHLASNLPLLNTHNSNNTYDNNHTER